MRTRCFVTFYLWQHELCIETGYRLKHSIDGCNTVLAGSPKTITDRLQRLLNAAARVVSDTGKFDRGLTHLLHSELHWLDVPQRILHKLGVTVHRCLQGKAPQYLVNCCRPTSDFASRQRLRSSSRHHLVVPRHRRSTLGRRAFSVAGPMAWNALPDDLRDPSPSADNFRKKLKTHLFRNRTWTLSALEALHNALYKFKTYLLTYLLYLQRTPTRYEQIRLKIWLPVFVSDLLDRIGLCPQLRRVYKVSPV